MVQGVIDPVLDQCWTPSTTVAQHWTNTGSTLSMIAGARAPGTSMRQLVYACASVCVCVGGGGGEGGLEVKDLKLFIFNCAINIRVVTI